MSIYRDEMQATMERAEQLVSENDELEQQAEALARENAELRARLDMTERLCQQTEAEPSDAPAANAPHARRGRPTVVVASTVVASVLAMAAALHWGADPTPRSSQDSQAVGDLDRERVRRIVEDHRMEVKRACWGRQAATAESSATVRAELVVDASGRVVRVATEGANPSVNACVEQQASGWVFPRSRERTTVVIPFMFVRHE